MKQLPTFCTALLILCTHALAADKPMNVIVLFADDWRFDAPEKYQEMMKNYYRLASEVDATCGRVIEELKKQGVLDNTLILFTGDNGNFHAEHGLADKWYPHQESIRVPLIVRDPRMAAAKRGGTNHDFTLNVDLAPTILAATGIQAPATMQARDMAPLYLATEKPT